MRKGKKGCTRRVLILLIICGNLGACSAISPVTQKTQCIAVQPVLVRTTVNDTSFIVPVDEMGQITAYIEQLRQCLGM